MSRSTSSPGANPHTSARTLVCYSASLRASARAAQLLLPSSPSPMAPAVPPLLLRTALRKATPSTAVSSVNHWPLHQCPSRQSRSMTIGTSYRGISSSLRRLRQLCRRAVVARHLLASRTTMSRAQWLPRRDLVWTTATPTAGELPLSTSVCGTRCSTTHF